MRIAVTQVDDSRLTPYRDLTQQNLVRRSGRFIAEGEKVVERLLASPLEVESILAVPEWADRIEPLLSPETTLFVASPELLVQIAGFHFHRGILACGRRPPVWQLPDWLKQIPATGEQTWVVLPDVQDPTNLGAILRTCQALGVTGVLLGKKCADPFSRRVFRVSMGGVLHLPLVESRDLQVDLKLLRETQGCELIATVLDPSAPQLETYDQRPSRLALLFGSEGHGLPMDCIEAASRKVTLTMQRQADSLNVAAAAAVFLYHFCRVSQVCQ